MKKDEKLQRLRREIAALRAEVALLRRQLLGASPDGGQQTVLSCAQRTENPAGEIRQARRDVAASSEQWSERPNCVYVHPVEQCDYCQYDLHDRAVTEVERFHLLDLSPGNCSWLSTSLSKNNAHNVCGTREHPFLASFIQAHLRQALSDW